MRAVLLACAFGAVVAVVATPAPAPLASAPAPPAPPALTPTPTPTLTVAVTNRAETVAFGEAIRYTITLRNRAAAPQRVMVRVTVPPTLDEVRIAGALPAVDGLVAWPVLVPAGSQSTVELQARAARSYTAVNTVTLTACGVPEGSQASAACATDRDDLLVRRTSASAAVPWLVVAAGLALLVAGGAAWRRRWPGRR